MDIGDGVVFDEFDEFSDDRTTLDQGEYVPPLGDV